VASPKRRPFEIVRDREEIASLYLKGFTQVRIAEHINIDPNRDYVLTRQQIGYDIRKVQDAWKKSALMDIDEAKKLELAKVDHLEREYWEAWERSCEDEETKRLEGTIASGEDKGKTTKQVVTRKAQNGDPRFLLGVQWCIERRCKIIGIDAPTKLAPTTPDGKESFGVVIMIPDNGRNDR